MTETTKMDKRGRITIPKDLRNAHDLEKDAEFIIEEIDDDTFILKKIDLKELIEDVKAEIEGKDIEKLHEEVEEEADELEDKVQERFEKEDLSEEEVKKAIEWAREN